MRRRTVLTGVLVWALVVVAVSAVTWAVIDAAGQDLLAGNSLVTDAAPAVPSTSASPPRSPSASPHPRRSHRPRSASSEEPVTTTSPSATSALRSAGPTSSDPSRAGGRTRTWEGPPGAVSVRCDGARISLLSASPSNGYRIEVERQPGEIEVHFKSSTREYQVKARCSAGTPRFEVESGGEKGDD